MTEQEEKKIRHALRLVGYVNDDTIGNERQGMLNTVERTLRVLLPKEKKMVPEVELGPVTVGERSAVVVYNVFGRGARCT